MPLPWNREGAQTVRRRFEWTANKAVPVHCAGEQPCVFMRSDSGLFAPPFEGEEEADVQHDAHHGGGGGRQTDHGQAGVGLNAHDVGHGQADEQGLHQALDHGP